MSCTSEKSALRATTLFGLLYLLSGAFITCVGIYTIHHLPELFRTGSVIWSGIIVSGLGVTAMMFACCGAVSFRKGLILVVIATFVMIVCVLNIVLLETIEWKYGIPPLPVEDPDEERRRDFLFFLTCLLSLFGTVLGLVTSVCNLIYAYCILLMPLKKLEKKRDILKERVQLHHTIKKPSPRARGVPDGNTNSKPPTRTSSPDQRRSNTLPKRNPGKHHGWVYNDISSELSVSSEGTEMTANKAFLKEILHTPVLVNSSKARPVSITTGPSENQEVVEVVDSGYQWKRRTKSSFRVNMVDRPLTTSRSIDVNEVGQSRERRQTTPNEQELNLDDVNTMFNQLEKALNASLSPETNISEKSPKPDDKVSSNDQDTQFAPPGQERQQTPDVGSDDFVGEMSSTRL